MAGIFLSVNEFGLKQTFLRVKLSLKGIFFYLCKYENM
jgi:hypothetical protein